MRPILWVAVIALLLAAVGSQLRVTTCVGECCEIEAGVATGVATGACCQVETEQGDACCGCCDELPSDGSPSESPMDDGTPPASPPGHPLGGCTPGCCLTMDFDIEMAPVDAPIELPVWFALALPPTTPCFAPMPVREFESMRPFDRGPPRIDRSTALRVCTVLLI